MAQLTLLLKLRRQDLLVIEKHFHNKPKENRKWKLVEKCERDQMVVSNIMAPLTLYSR